MRRLACTAVALTALVAPGAAAAAGRPDVAALQVALRGAGTYGGSIDGVAGPGTRAAVSRFQARNGLPADGAAGPATRAALGRRGRPALGSRTMHSGQSGWDVAALQFSLGHPSVVSVIPGPVAPEEVRQNLAWMRRDIPAALWAELGAEGLIRPDAPTPRR